MKLPIQLVLVASVILFWPSIVFFWPLLQESFETPKAFALIGFACLSMPYVLLHGLSCLKERVGFHLLLFVASMGISTVFSIDKHISIFGNPKMNNGLLVWISYLIFYIATCQSIKSLKDKIFLVRIIVSLSFIVSLYAIAQAFGYDIQQWIGVLIDKGYGRPMSTLGHPNFMAAYLSMTLPFALYRIERGKNLESILSTFPFLASIFAIILSQSRGMWIATSLAMICYMMMRKIPKNIIALFFILISMVFASASTLIPSFGSGAIGRVETLFKPERTRIEYPKAALRIWEKHPFIGIGTDNFELAFDNQRTPYYWWLEPRGSPHRAHCEPLNILATQGTLGFYLALMFTLSVISLIMASQSELKIPATAAIVAFYVQELSSFHVIATMILFLVCICFLRKDKPI